MTQPRTLSYAEHLFAGRRVWVSGAASGIGAQIAADFARLGAEVVAIDCRFDAPPEEATQRRVRLDVADHAAVESACRELLDAGLGPDVLVNAAGVLRLGALDALSVADWLHCFEVNVDGVFYLLRALLPHFKARRRGSIVNVASNAAHVPRLEMGAYCASKAALASLSHCAALELAEYGVRCNLVSPGSTDTPMLRAMLGGEDAMRRTIGGLPERYKLGIPLRKIAEPREIADAVLFLASDLASHITLHDLVVDGGATLAA
ncbi:MAG: 2,3-dihydro-2,3-dihydroxybenzoate dehydrogenase [Solimonas sp.]